jgi:hypothetical protein
MAALSDKYVTLLSQIGTLARTRSSIISQLEKRSLDPATWQTLTTAWNQVHADTLQSIRGYGELAGTNLDMPMPRGTRNGLTFTEVEICRGCDLEIKKFVALVEYEKGELVKLEELHNQLRSSP